MFWWLMVGTWAVLGLVSAWGRWSGHRMGRPLPPALPLGRRHNWQEGRCVLVYGRLGFGKTALVMQRAVKHARRHRLPLIANADVRADALVLKSWDDLANLMLCTEATSSCSNDSADHRCPGCHPAVIVLDEVHMWLPAQQGLMPTEVVRSAIHLLSYARKRGWTIYATTQYPTRVSTQFRYLATEMIEVRPFSQGLLHWTKQIDPDTGKPVLGFAGVFFPRRARYNTRAEVEPLWQQDGGGGVAAAPSATERRPVPQVGPIRRRKLTQSNGQVLEVEPLVGGEA